MGNDGHSPVGEVRREQIEFVGAFFECLRANAVRPYSLRPRLRSATSPTAQSAAGEAGVLPHRRDDRKGRPCAIFQNFCNESPFRQSYGCKEVIL